MARASAISGSKITRPETRIRSPAATGASERSTSPRLWTLSMMSERLFVPTPVVSSMASTAELSASARRSGLLRWAIVRPVTTPAAGRVRAARAAPPLVGGAALVAAPGGERVAVEGRAGSARRRHRLGGRQEPARALRQCVRERRQGLAHEPVLVAGGAHAREARGVVLAPELGAASPTAAAH